MGYDATRAIDRYVAITLGRWGMVRVDEDLEISDSGLDVAFGERSSVCRAQDFSIGDTGSKTEVLGANHQCSLSSMRLIKWDTAQFGLRGFSSGSR